MSYARGLEGVVVGETAVSNVEGNIGRLTYRGYAIDLLIQRNFSEVLWLVCCGEFPQKTQLEEMNRCLQTEKTLTKTEKKFLDAIPPNVHPMIVLQSMIPMLNLEPETLNNNLDADFSRGLKVIAKLPEILIRHRQKYSGGSDVVVNATGPQGEYNYLKDFLSRFTGEEVTEKQLEIFNLIQIVQMEHSFNAGTFATMVVSSTLASLEASMSAGVGALSGVLHGGADQAALETARLVGDPSNAGQYVEQLLANGGKLMGMGHREYKVMDPRSVLLKPLAREVCMGSRHEQLYLTLEALEIAFSQAMKRKGRALWANLEFYKGVAMLALGIPQDYFTAVFALSRSVGWLAHFLETKSDNRIYRPKALYVGEYQR
ncbi:MAG: hypothetical protein OEZ23_04675 [Gammaproteobacteria bacterium]|nr:hypothetical protein [Gammaproteobacteria bacterium]